MLQEMLDASSVMAAERMLILSFRDLTKQSLYDQMNG
jgi:hypothetical protein